MPDRFCDVRFPDSRRAGDQDILFEIDEPACRQVPNRGRRKLSLIETEIEFLESPLISETCRFQEFFEPVVIAAEPSQPSIMTV